MYFHPLIKTPVNLVLKKLLYNNMDHYKFQLINHIYLYFIAKVTELLDTIFFVIRKKDKQVTFLHLYHHSIMMIGTWAYLKYSPSDNVVFIGFMNSLVHVFMYSYYGLAALGPGVAKYLWWKKYMTTFQLVSSKYIYILSLLPCRSSNSLVIILLS